MTAMSNLVMARIRPLNGPLLAAAEQHGRRLDEAAIRRKVRDDPSLTWVPEGIEEDPLALSDRLADHVRGAMVPKAKAKALHMLVKLPASVPVETEADARKALDLVVEFAQDTYGGNAVFSARMDRDERSLNSVDLFLAPRYVKKTKRKSQEAISLTRFGKLLAEKRGIEDRSDTAKGSMQAQGSALQDELADWLTAKGFEAQRGRPKDRDGDDWQTPEVMGARKDRAAVEAFIAEQLPEIVEKRREADRLLADAARIKAEAEAAAEEAKRHAEAAARAAGDAIRAQAEADAATIRNGARAEADRLAAEVFEDREQRLGEAERVVAADRQKVDRGLADVSRRVQVTRIGEDALATRQAKVADRETKVSDREVAADSREAEVDRKAGLLDGMIERLEPLLSVVADAHARLQAAPEHVRRWLDGDGRVGAAVRTAGPIVRQATDLLGKLVRRPKVAEPAPAEEIDLETLAAARDGRTGIKGR
jgi:cell division septum initiation protein DivIVA